MRSVLAVVLCLVGSTAFAGGMIDTWERPRYEQLLSDGQADDAANFAWVAYIAAIQSSPPDMTAACERASLAIAAASSLRSTKKPSTAEQEKRDKACSQHDAEARRRAVMVRPIRAKAEGAGHVLRVRAEKQPLKTGPAIMDCDTGIQSAYVSRAAIRRIVLGLSTDQNERYMLNSLVETESRMGASLPVCARVFGPLYKYAPLAKPGQPPKTSDAKADVTMPAESCSDLEDRLSELNQLRTPADSNDLIVDQTNQLDITLHMSGMMELRQHCPEQAGEAPKTAKPSESR
jgi:hypothetical protein